MYTILLANETLIDLQRPDKRRIVIDSCLPACLSVCEQAYLGFFISPIGPWPKLQENFGATWSGYLESPPARARL